MLRKVKRNRRHRLLNREKAWERIARARTAGFVQILTFIDERDDKAIQAHARNLKIPKVSVSRAVMRAGMRYVSTSAIIQEHARWKTIFDKPIGPRYPGSEFDPARRGRGPKKGFREETTP